MLGLGLFKWDFSLGVVLDVKYPTDFEIEDNFVNKILMAHSIGEQKSEDYIELEMNDKVIFSLWKHLGEERGYELIILVIDQEKKLSKQQYKHKFLKFAKEVLTKPQGDDRQEYFLSNVRMFSLDSMGKILLLGRANTGKSSIKQVIFEGKDPKELLSKPLAPTIGLKPKVYSWLDLDLSIFDTVGQRFNDYLENEKQKMMVFSSVTTVIYLFDYKMWINDKTLIFNDIKAISEVIKKEPDPINFVLFFHKIDLIEENVREEKINDIKKVIGDQFSLEIYFTSLYPSLIYELYTAFCKQLSQLSEESAFIRGILKEGIKNNSKTMLFITNENNNIIAQIFTPDFNFKIINYVHNIIANINLVFEDTDAENKIKFLTLSMIDDYNIVMRKLKVRSLKNLVSISGTLKTEQLVELMDELSTQLNQEIN